MQIDANEKISIWLIGNTGLRNPLRIHDGFLLFANSPYIGHFRGVENSLGFTKLLNDNGIIKNEAGKDATGSHARKWRLMFERFGFIYGQVKKNDPFKQTDLGEADTITPFGSAFKNADTFPAIQECFLRSLIVEQYLLPNATSRFSPLRWILAIMLELEKRTGSSALSRIEFALWGDTTNPSYSLSDVVDHILDLRQRRSHAPAKKSFDWKEITIRSEHYGKKSANFLDYCDMNMRYLRISGILQRKGRGIQIVPAKHLIAQKLAKSTFSTTPLFDELKCLTNGAPLPTDDFETGKNVLENLVEQLRKRHIVFDLSAFPLTTAAEVNIARHHLEETLAKTNEIYYAAKQKDQWREISEYMDLLIKGGGKSKAEDDDNIIEVPKDETPAYLEWVLWRAALAVNHLVNKPYEIRGFRLDADFFPVSAAGGGRGDLYCEFKDFTILTEVTMSSSSRQEAMEGEPVRRHVSDAIELYNKPVYGMFIANKIDTNTAETFRHGIWYTKNDVRQRLTIGKRPII